MTKSSGASHAAAKRRRGDGKTTAAAKRARVSDKVAAVTRRVARTQTTPPRVLVIYKKSAYQIYVRERAHTHIQELIEAGNASVAHLSRAHGDHMQALHDAREALTQLGARVSFRHRSDPGQANAFDLVVTLGGDGTLLWVSHMVGDDVPIVAINTAPSDSVGYFCAGTRHELADVLADAISGKLKTTELARMRATVNGERLSNRVLNDVLFSHQCPASTSRYAISIGARHEQHKSSGVWVGPAAGSTAAQSSAGGRVLPIRSQQLQWVVREAYNARRQGFRMLQGVVGVGQKLCIESHIRAGRLYIDGPHRGNVIEMASRIELELSDEPLSLLGFRDGGAARLR